MTFAKGKRFIFLPTHTPNAPEPELPSARRMAVNFARSVARSAISQVRGNPRHVSEATRDARRARCVANVCGFYRASDGRCAHARCGCPVSQRGLIESKTELFSERCPADPSQWGAGEITNE